MAFDPTKYGAVPFDPTKLGATPINQNVQATAQAKPGVFQRVESALNKTVGKVADTFQGTTGKTVGTLIGASGVLGSEAQKKAEAIKITPTDIAFTALELYPGGGALSAKLRALPGGEMAANALKNVIDFVPNQLRKQAIAQYTRALAPTTQEAKGLAEKTVPKLLNKGQASLTRSGLLEKAETLTTKYGGKIDDFFKALPEGTQNKVQPLLDGLEGLKNQFVDITKEGKRIVVEPESIKHIENIQNVLAQYGDNISTESMRKVRQIWDASVSKAKGYAGKTLAEGSEVEAKRQAANAIRKELAKQYPELAKLNAEYSLWENTARIVEATQRRLSGNQLTGRLLRDVGFGLTGSVIGGSGEGSPVTNAFAAAGAIELLTSPGWRMVSAVAKNKLANALVSGAGKEAIRRAVTAIKNEITRSSAKSEQQSKQE
jgi:hypothetical protein